MRLCLTWGLVTYYLLLMPLTHLVTRRCAPHLEEPVIRTEPASAKGWPLFIIKQRSGKYLPDIRSSCAAVMQPPGKCAVSNSVRVKAQAAPTQPTTARAAVLGLTGPFQRVWISTPSTLSAAAAAATALGDVASVGTGTPLPLCAPPPHLNSPPTQAHSVSTVQSMGCAPTLALPLLLSLAGLIRGSFYDYGSYQDGRNSTGYHDHYRFAHL